MFVHPSRSALGSSHYWYIRGWIQEETFHLHCWSSPSNSWKGCSDRNTKIHFCWAIQSGHVQHYKLERRGIEWGDCKYQQGLIGTQWYPSMHRRIALTDDKTHRKALFSEDCKRDLGLITEYLNGWKLFLFREFCNMMDPVHASSSASAACIGHNKEAAFYTSCRSCSWGLGTSQSLA